MKRVETKLDNSHIYVRVTALRAAQNTLVGRMWPAGRSFPTSVLNNSDSNLLNGSVDRYINTFQVQMHGNVDTSIHSKCIQLPKSQARYFCFSAGF